MAIGPLPLDEPIPYVLTAPEPKPVKRETPPPKTKRVYKKSKSRTISEPRSKHQRPILVEPRHLPLTYEVCQRELGSGPCPYISCRHHLLSEEMGNGVKLHHLVLSGELFDMENPPETCSLRQAERGPLELKDIGRAMGEITDERVRNIEETAYRKLGLNISRGGIDFLRGRRREAER
jgi:hypothetical protein